jgi:HEAT repeat protein
MNAHISDEEMRENLHLLGSEHGDYQSAIQWFRDQGKQVSPFLMAALQEGRTTYLQKARIIETLGELREGASVPLLVTILQSGELSWEAAQALGKIGTQDAEDALVRCLLDARLAIVKECTKALGYIHSEAAFAALQRQLQHADASVRYYAVQSLIQMQPSGLFDTLSTHLSQEQDSDVRRLIKELLE